MFRGNGGGAGNERFALRAGYTGTGQANRLHQGVRRLDGDTWTQQTAPNALGTAFRMLAIFHDYSTGVGRLFEDGAQVGSATVTSAGVTSNTTGAQSIAIGGHTSLNQFCADVDLAAVLVGAGSLPSTDEIDRLFGWLAWRFELTDLLAVDHPYKDAPPYVEEDE